jgi:hypothetical protein
MQSLLTQYSWDVGLQSWLPAAKRLNMDVAAESERARGDQQFAAGEFDHAASSYLQARTLNPARAIYEALYYKAAEAQFVKAFRPMYDEAEKEYRARRFDEAAQLYQKLANVTSGHPTRFPLLLRVATQRARAAKEPRNPSARLQAGNAAMEVGFCADAIEEYTALTEISLTTESAGALVRASVAQASQGDKPDFPAIQKVVQLAAALGGKLKPQEAGEVHHTLARALLDRNLKAEGLQELAVAASCDRSLPRVTELTREELQYANTLSGAARDAEYRKASAAIALLGEGVTASEEAYELKDQIDRAAKLDTTPPFLRVTVPAPSREGKPLSGSVPLSIYMRDRFGVTKIEVQADGHPASLRAGGAFSSHIDIDLATQTTRKAVWDTTSIADGKHVLHFVAVDAKGNKGEASIEVAIKNLPDRPAPPPFGEVWASTRTRRYHLPSCPDAPPPAERIIFRNAGLADGGGYRPCIKCRP